MNLSKAEILSRFNVWLMAWNEYDLDGVMELMHEDIVFENWDGSVISGKTALARSWAMWFRHRDFKFVQEDLFIDEEAQKIAFTWHLVWPSPEKNIQEKRKYDEVLIFFICWKEKLIRKILIPKPHLQ